MSESVTELCPETVPGPMPLSGAIMQLRVAFVAVSYITQRDGVKCAGGMSLLNLRDCSASINYVESRLL